jgi:hypothetical protein
MVRIGARSARPDLLVAAFADGRGRRTVILLHRGTRPLRVAVPGSFRWREEASLYRENGVDPAPAAAGGVTTVTVAPGAIVTLSGVPLGGLPPGFRPEEEG